jgi:glycosyltransferase involved in cell wall biosynthesis
MKSICLLVQNYYETDIRVRRKAEALVASGYSVDVFALASSYSQASSYNLNGVNVFVLGLGKKRASLVRYAFEYLAFFAWCFVKLSLLMSKRRYAIIDVNNLPDFLVFAAAYAKLRGAKIIFDMHEITPEFYMSKFGVSDRSLGIRFLKLIERMSIAFADHVITINEPIKKLLEGRGLNPAKTCIVMNSVDESLFADALKNAAATPVRGTSSKYIMMYHGTLTHIYGLDLAIDAFAMACREMPDAEFWILGGGPEKNSLMEQSRRLGVADNMKFLGNVLPQQIPAFLKQCDVGVLATRQDVFLDLSFSNKLSEYIIMGKPIISSRLRTIHHYFSQEALAFFEPNDPSDLARQMVRTFLDPRLRLRLATAAKQQYAPINWEVMRDRYLAAISALCDQRAAVGNHVMHERVAQ